MAEQNAHHDTLDLVRALKVLLGRKWLVILGTAAFTLAAVLVTLVLPATYRSEAFLQLSSGMDIDLEEVREIQQKIREDLHNHLLDNTNTLQKNALVNETLENSGLMMKIVSIPDYKKYLSRFTNPRQFLGYAGLRKETGADGPGMPDSTPELSALVPEDIAAWLEPVYAYSKKDMGDLGQIAKDVKNFVVGVKIHGERPTPQKALRLARMMGNFIRDSILYGKLSGYINGQLNQGRRDAKTYENFLIMDEFKLKQLTQKRDHIRDLLTQYPQSKAMVGRELFTDQPTGHRYLSPVAQLVGIESHIADIRENLARNRRNRQVEELRREFFSKAGEFTEKESFGDPLLQRCMKLSGGFSDKKEIPADVLRQVKNELTADLDNFRNLYEEMRFLSGPTLPQKPVKPLKMLIAAVALVLGFFIFVFLAFFLEWWQSNKNAIRHPE